MESVPDLHVIGAGAGVGGTVGGTFLPAIGVRKVAPIGVPRTGKLVPGVTPFVGGSTVGVECDGEVVLPGVLPNIPD